MMDGAAAIDVYKRQAPVYIKKLCNSLLGQPNVVILYPYLNAILMSIFREHKEIHCAVAVSYTHLCRTLICNRLTIRQNT